METVTSNELTFPEGIDESKVDALLQEILGGIDRSRLIQDTRLTRVRHPLLTERMGQEIALNTEIHNLITDIVTQLLFLDKTTNQEQSLANIRYCESILLDSAQDPETLQANLSTLKELVTQLAKLNPEEDGAEVEGLVSRQLREKLAMPNMAQDLILYPPVTGASLGESPAKVLETLENCKNHLLAILEDKSDDDSNALRAAIEDEAAAVKEWFENMAV